MLVNATEIYLKLQESFYQPFVKRFNNFNSSLDIHDKINIISKEVILLDLNASKNLLYKEIHNFYGNDKSAMNEIIETTNKKMLESISLHFAVIENQVVNIRKTIPNGFMDRILMEKGEFMKMLLGFIAVIALLPTGIGTIPGMLLGIGLAYYYRRRRDKIEKASKLRYQESVNEFIKELNMAWKEMSMNIFSHHEKEQAASLKQILDADDKSPLTNIELT